MSEQIQKLEQTVTTLKSRLFDTQEQLAQLNEGAQSISEALSKIVSILGLQPKEDGTIGLQEIVDAVQSLVPVQQELEVEPD